ncbi:monovalent cation/H(+) antiporter subunit G [Allosediminivita pacifica]|uniref:Multisubunit potassium/proton antiporter PhaG subunit n=1 Tax=Allosediminivita pacifica TaxID=1267769 RepID=A0A2T6AUB7_9RHOB|nr:monovalent cation/H(+) antiporter subunit G [Allosediminivita pacifica]PTX47407.1 multisubunit potassium/proton antiporter PhaG subunit [Allosediminivita pacifica]GGB14027.1 Na+/H+ antiporter subunit G [Allosediminivita pacifica]
MTLEVLGIYATAIFLLIGSVFVIVGVIGLLKFSDPMTRLHAPTKVGTLGIGMLLLASITHSFATGGSSIHELLIMAFLFVTAPISANFIAKANIHRGVCAPLPDLPDDGTWSTLTPVENERAPREEATEGGRA